MPISFDLEGLRKEYGCVHYFETGLWDPRDDVSSKKALTCGFETVHCIEIRKDWVELGREMMKEHIDAGKYHLYLDDSANMKSYLTANQFKEKTMFFLVLVADWPLECLPHLGRRLQEHLHRVRSLRVRR